MDGNYYRLNLDHMVHILADPVWATDSVPVEEVEFDDDSLLAGVDAADLDLLLSSRLPSASILHAKRTETNEYDDWDKVAIDGVMLYLSEQ